MLDDLNWATEHPNVMKHNLLPIKQQDGIKSYTDTLTDTLLGSESPKPGVVCQQTDPAFFLQRPHLS